MFRTICHLLLKETMAKLDETFQNQDKKTRKKPNQKQQTMLNIRNREEKKATKR